MKKKILIASDSFLPKLDGVSIFLKRVIPEMSNEFKLTLVAPNYKGKFTHIPKINIYRTKVCFLKIANYNIPKPSIRLIKKLVKQNDIIFIQDIGPIGLVSLLYAKKYKKKIIAYVHTIEEQRFAECSEATSRLKLLSRFITKRYEKWFYNSCDKLIVSSNSISRVLSKQEIKTDFEQIPLGIDVDKFKPAKNKKTAKARIGIKEDIFIVGYLGRISKEKNLKTLREAFLNLPFNNKLLLIVGGGSFLQRRVFNKVKAKKVTGFVQDPIKYLQAMDVYVLPSLTETSSLSTLEAMATGIPVITTPVGSIPDYIMNKENGLLFAKKDSEKLKELILELYKDDNLRDKLGKNARNTSMNYLWKNTINRLTKLFREI